MSAESMIQEEGQVRLRREVAALMADGRERTREDVVYRLGCAKHSATVALNRLVEFGLLSREQVGAERICVYRRAS